MVTGIECAGLVLAVFPLVIEGLGSYSRGFQKLANCRQYAVILSGYRMHLEVEYLKFNNTWKRILELLDHSTLERICGSAVSFEQLKTPQDIAKYNLSLATLLSLALSNSDDHTVQVFEAAIGEISELLQCMVRDFNLDFGECLQLPNNAPFSIALEPPKARLKGVRKMLKAELKGSNDTRNEQLSHIRLRNEDLHNIISGEYQGQILSNVRTPHAQLKTSKIAITATRLYNAIQKQTKALHAILEETLQISGSRCCESPHGASLQLEVRDASTLKQFPAFRVHEDPDSQLQYSWRFAFCFSFEKSLTSVGELSTFCDLEAQMLSFTTDNAGNNVGNFAKCFFTNQSGNATDDTGSNRSLSSKRTGEMPNNSHEHRRQKISESPKDKYSSKLLADGRPSPLTIVFSKLSIKSRDSRYTVQGNSSSSAPVDTPALPSREYNNHPDYALTTMIVKNTQAACKSCSVPNDQILISVCSAIQATQNSPPSCRSCLGVLSSALDKFARFRLCPRGANSVKMLPKHLISLRDLLCQSSDFQGGNRPSKLTRLKLAVILASSVMQLHGTNWLREFWSTSDIFYKKTQKGPMLLDRPYVQYIFHSPLVQTDLLPRTSDADPNSLTPANLFANCIPFANSMLFSLGIILIEVHNWKTFTTLFRERGGHEKLALQTLGELVRELGDCAGRGYQSVVKRCIQGLERDERDLDHDEFKGEVYEKIVLPLESELKTFCWKGNLGEIFSSS